MYRTHFFLVISFLTWSILLNAQRVNKVIELDKEALELIEASTAYSNGLLRSRGSSKLSFGWRDSTGVDSLRSLLRYLDYYDEIGILIFNHKNDTLYSVLLHARGASKVNANYIGKDSLIGLIDNANKHFSATFLSRSAEKRGMTAVTSESRTYLAVYYQNACAILNPFESELLKLDHLIIVPTLNLATFPFSALQLKDSYLIDRMSYSIAPSLPDIFQDQAKIQKRLGYLDHHISVGYNIENALFVANPHYPKNSLWNFPDLPGAELEVNVLTEKLDSAHYTKLTGKDATLTKVRESICTYDLLYFATHGLSDSEDPLDKSFLVLSDDPEGAYFTAREIQHLGDHCAMNADLVVLSACQTGLGQAHEGGVIGLSRAFQLAGANHVLMSLWNISDKETAVLMGYFFDRFREGGRLMPHEALRAAILKYRSEVSDNPNYWAAFSIFGSPY